MGIIPRMMNKIFDSIMEADEKIEFTVKVTFLEIYLEKLKDLLDRTKTNLKIKEHPRKGTFV